MGQTVKGMSNAMKAMDPEKIAKTMEQFEKQFEDMDVRSGYMEDTMDATTAMSTPPEQVDNLIQMVADEAGLQLEGLIDSAGPVGTKEPAQPGNISLAYSLIPHMIKSAAQKDDLESRLAALRK
jgi:charged multivesicular body protein 1